MTDIEGSTRVWDASPKLAKQALERHDRILLDQVERNHGQIVEAGREGDSFLAVFKQASDAVGCALDMQRALHRESWPSDVEMHVRIGMHTGEAELRAGHYVGAPLYRCARLLAMAHGGQVLISRAAEEILADSLPDDVTLRDLGRFQLRDLSRPEHVFQLEHPELRTEFPPLKSDARPRTSLPEPLTSFVGRQSELSALKKALKDARLLTILGAGGIGKTRLAIQLVRSLADTWPDGGYWVDLTPVDDRQQVAGTIASALPLRVSGDPLQVVKSWLSNRRSLLVLDNCEHLLDSCAAFCRDVLAPCPGLSIVATSREALGVPGETQWPLASLSEADAAELFVQRGRLVRPAFQLTESNEENVSEICRTVDQLPLGVELAASKLDFMSESEIAAQLKGSLGLLTSTSRIGNSRHQTMAATVGWSYNLLAIDESTLFRRLAVFRGGFTSESAEAVCRDDRVPDVLSTLGGLVRKSMVLVERMDQSQTRYRLLETQALYAATLLETSTELLEIQRRHFEYFSKAMESRTPLWVGPAAEIVRDTEQAAWKRRELGNLWAALRWARANTEDLGLALAARVAWIGGADLKANRAWLNDLLQESPVKGYERLLATSAAWDLALMQGDFEEARRLAETALELARESHPTVRSEEIAQAYKLLGIALDAMGRLDDAQSAFEQALKHLAGTTNLRLVGSVQNTLGCLALAQGRFEFARDTLEDALRSLRPFGGPEATSAVIESLANAQLECGDLESAELNWKQSLAMDRELRLPWDASMCIAGLSRVASARGDHSRALRLAGAHERLCSDWSIGQMPYWRTSLARATETSRSKLVPSKCNQAWNDGLAMDLDRATDYALEQSPQSNLDFGPLTGREIEVAGLIAKGMTNREIAAKLFISERTAEGHIERIRNKLGFRSRSEVARWAVERGA